MRRMERINFCGQFLAQRSIVHQRQDKQQVIDDLDLRKMGLGGAIGQTYIRIPKTNDSQENDTQIANYFIKNQLPFVYSPDEKQGINIDLFR